MATRLPCSSASRTSSAMLICVSRGAYPGSASASLRPCRTSSMDAAGATRLGLFDVNPAAAEALAGRLRTHYPQLALVVGTVLLYRRDSD